MVVELSTRVATRWANIQRTASLFVNTCRQSSHVAADSLAQRLAHEVQTRQSKPLHVRNTDSASVWSIYKQLEPIAVDTPSKILDTVFQGDFLLLSKALLLFSMSRIRLPTQVLGEALSELKREHVDRDKLLISGLLTLAACESDRVNDISQLIDYNLVMDYRSILPGCTASSYLLALALMDQPQDARFRNICTTLVQICSEKEEDLSLQDIVSLKYAFKLLGPALSRFFTDVGITTGNFVRNVVMSSTICEPPIGSGEKFVSSFERDVANTLLELGVNTDLGVMKIDPFSVSLRSVGEKKIFKCDKDSDFYTNDTSRRCASDTWRLIILQDLGWSVYCVANQRAWPKHDEEKKRIVLNGLQNVSSIDFRKMK